MPCPPREEAGIYLTLERNPGSWSQFKSHIFPHPLEIQFECQPRINSYHEESSDGPVANPKRAPGPKFNSTGGLKPL